MSTVSNDPQFSGPYVRRQNVFDSIARKQATRELCANTFLAGSYMAHGRSFSFSVEGLPMRPEYVVKGGYLNTKTGRSVLLLTWP